MANEEQRKAWDGPEGDIWTENESFYSQGARFLTPHLFAAAEIGPGERVLDVGCGTGETTRLAARAGKEALGVDLSWRMLARARERATAEALTNVLFEQADAQTHTFEQGAFDVVISRFGAMFFDDPVAAFTNIARALTPGAGVAMLCWRSPAENEWVSELLRAVTGLAEVPSPPPGAPGPFAFADAGYVRGILRDAGSVDITLDPVEEPMFIGSDANEAFESLMRLSVVAGATRDMDDAGRRAVSERVRALAGDHETSDGVLLGSAAWMVRARAR
ncbi:MAG TPA: methyltransferase domain-containing protein [Actinomycetota bacterium]